MATKQSKSGSGRRANGSASQKPEKYRFAQNLDGDQTAAELEYREYSAEAEAGDSASDGPDVLVDVPVVKVDSLHLEVDDLEAQVSLQAQVLELLDLDVGVDVHVGRVKLDIKGVEAQALLKVRLDHVTAIVDRVMTTLDRNPELVESIGRTVEHVGSGAGETLEGVGEAEEKIGEAVEEKGGELGETVGQTAGKAVQAIPQVAGGDLDPRELLDDSGNVTGPKLAKAAARSVAKEIGSAASEEMKDLGAAASRRVQAIGERRRQRKAEKLDATEAAVREADELGVDLGDVEGSGADGRIVVNDVRRAAGSEG